MFDRWGERITAAAKALAGTPENLAKLLVESSPSAPTARQLARAAELAAIQQRLAAEQMPPLIGNAVTFLALGGERAAQTNAAAAQLYQELEIRAARLRDIGVHPEPLLAATQAHVEAVKEAAFRMVVNGMGLERFTQAVLGGADPQQLAEVGLMAMLQQWQANQQR